MSSRIQPERLLFVGPRRRYHSQYSGYETLARHLDGNGAHVSEVRLPEAVAEASRSASSLLSSRFRAWLLRPVGDRWYGRERILEELRTAPALVLGRRTVIHHLYAEESCRIGGFLPRLRGSRLVGTFHQPPSTFAEFVRSDALLRRLDAVVAVGREQAAHLERLRGDRVHYVPHGVDTEFFTPGSPPRGGNFTCLFVGYWLRDFDTLEAVVRNLVPEGIRFHFVMTPGKARRFRDVEGVEVSTGLDDLAFRDAYRRASLFLLPVHDATANNALLEAMASGLPVVATNVGGMPDYCNPDMSILTPPGDARAMSEAVRTLATDRERLDEMRHEARRRAVEEFDWTVVARAMRGVYEDVLS